MASSASLIVTPFKFRAVTSRPVGKRKSIFLTGGVVRSFFNTSLSSSDAGEVFSFLEGRPASHLAYCTSNMYFSLPTKHCLNHMPYSPVELLGLFGDCQLFPFGLYIDLSAFVSDHHLGEHVITWEMVMKCPIAAVPRSAMLNTPVTLELVRRCDFLPSFGGELA